MNERGGNGGGSGDVDALPDTLEMANMVANIVVNAIPVKKCIETTKLLQTKFKERLIHLMKMQLRFPSYLNMRLKQYLRI